MRLFFTKLGVVNLVLQKQNFRNPTFWAWFHHDKLHETLLIVANVPVPVKIWWEHLLWIEKYVVCLHLKNDTTKQGKMKCPLIIEQNSGWPVDKLRADVVPALCDAVDISVHAVQVNVRTSAVHVASWLLHQPTTVVRVIDQLVHCRLSGGHFLLQGH